MSVLEWHAGLNVGIGFMDQDHDVAATQINAMAAAQTPQDRLVELDAFIEHCRHHFAHEEEMMQQTGFFALQCHKDEHDRVLAELSKVRAVLAAGDAQDIYFTKALPDWLLNHRNTMDFVTAQFAAQRGFVAA